MQCTSKKWLSRRFSKSWRRKLNRATYLGIWKQDCRHSISNQRAPTLRQRLIKQNKVFKEFWLKRTPMGISQIKLSKQVWNRTRLATFKKQRLKMRNTNFRWTTARKPVETSDKGRTGSSKRPHQWSWVGLTRPAIKTRWTMQLSQLHRTWILRKTRQRNRQETIPLKSLLLVSSRTVISLPPCGPKPKQTRCLKIIGRVSPQRTCRRSTHRSGAS